MFQGGTVAVEETEVVDEPRGIEEPDAAYDPELVDEDDPDDPGVTPSADWEHDDDPASYSAPI